MRRSDRIIAFVRQQDWRIWFGVVVTVIWMTGGIWFVTNAVRSNPEQGVSLGIIGSFLEGAFAPYTLDEVLGQLLHGFGGLGVNAVVVDPDVFFTGQQFNVFRVYEEIFAA